MTSQPAGTQQQYAVPALLRDSGFVPRQPGTRRPAPVLPAAFTRRGRPVPAERGQWNCYQLTERQGYPWSPELDAYVSRCGAELLGRGRTACLDVDNPLAVDGTPMVNALKWLTDQAAKVGEILDVTACLSVRTPGHRDRGHGEGWHFWYRIDPDRPVRFGALDQLKIRDRDGNEVKPIEIKSRATCPGSPGYVVHAAPEELSLLPGWLAELIGPPRERQPSAAGGGPVRVRLEGIVTRLLDAANGERNHLLFWAAARCGEMVSGGQLDAATARKVLADAAAEIGLRPGEAGPTIDSGLADGAR
jgi:hypothetical protein